jgi:hypothetical protein
MIMPCGTQIIEKNAEQGGAVDRATAGVLKIVE